jgi:hypothetical protein
MVMMRGGLSVPAWPVTEVGTLLLADWTRRTRDTGGHG